MPAQTDLTKLAHESPAQARKKIIKAVAKAHGVLRVAAGALAVNVATLYRLLPVVGMLPADLPPRVSELAEVEPEKVKQLMLGALKRHKGQRKAALESLGLSHSTWRRLVAKLDLGPVIEKLYPCTEGGGGVHGAEHLAKLRKNAAGARAEQSRRAAERRVPR